MMQLLVVSIILHVFLINLRFQGESDMDKCYAMKEANRGFRCDLLRLMNFFVNFIRLDDLDMNFL